MLVLRLKSQMCRRVRQSLSDRPVNSTDAEPPAYHAVVPAAGAGSRMNSVTPKQYIDINGRAMLLHTVERLLQVESLQSIVVVLDKITCDDSQLKFYHPKITTCVGGSSRAESVHKGLQHLATIAEPASRVLVHDAARPCVRVEDINRLISQTAGSEGGLLAMPVVDTLKRADSGLQVMETVDRAHLWRAATPQLFPYHLLLQALGNALEEGIEITDEASAMQHAGYNPVLVECSADNIKVTTATDLALAEHFLAVQQAEKSSAD